MQSVADGRVSVTGHAKLVPEDQQAAFRQQYMKKNTESFWADFGDFKAYHMAEVLAVHFNGGFGRAGTKVWLPVHILLSPTVILGTLRGHMFTSYISCAHNGQAFLPLLSLLDTAQ